MKLSGLSAPSMYVTPTACSFYPQVHKMAAGASCITSCSRQGKVEGKGQMRHVSVVYLCRSFLYIPHNTYIYISLAKICHMAIPSRTGVLLVRNKERVDTG